jgi:hypothetical protein
MRHCRGSSVRVPPPGFQAAPKLRIYAYDPWTSTLTSAIHTLDIILRLLWTTMSSDGQPPQQRIVPPSRRRDKPILSCVLCRRRK